MRATFALPSIVDLAYGAARLELSKALARRRSRRKQLHRFSTDFSISGTNDVRGRISVVRTGPGRTRIVASFGPKPPAFERIVGELVAVALVLPPPRRPSELRRRLGAAAAEDTTQNPQTTATATTRKRTWR